jgi:hypothetical protein
MTQTKTNPFDAIAYIGPVKAPVNWRSICHEYALGADKITLKFFEAARKLMYGEIPEPDELELLLQYLKYFLKAPCWEHDEDIAFLLAEIEHAESYKDLKLCLNRAKALRLRIFE